MRGVCAVWRDFADRGRVRVALRGGRGGGGGFGVEWCREGLSLVIDAGQERDGLLGAVDQAVTVRQEADRLFVLGQRRGEFGLTLLEVGDDPCKMVEGVLEREALGGFGVHEG